MVGLEKFVVASMLLGLAGACTPTTNVATATEAEICRAWRDSLPSRSSQDTETTRAEIGTAYDVQAAACPAFARF
jgi:dihydrodipicolinate synthase/N-acetylneuraminate lyase